MRNNHLKLAKQLSQIFRSRNETRAVALGGSVASGRAEADSDIDLYVFCDPVIPICFREEIVKAMHVRDAELNLTFWDTGDAWYDPETGIEVDIMYWQPAWIESQLNRVLLHHQAALGYSSCFWYTLQKCQVLHDPASWLKRLKQKAAKPYPATLRDNIIRKTHPVLRKVIPSYTHQIEKALRRGDFISINHRVAELLASYFDILFAYNRQLHPGEKRLVEQALALCPQTPENMVEDLQRVLNCVAKPDTDLLLAIHELIDQLD